MHQVVGGVAACGGLLCLTGVEDVTFYDLDVVEPGPAGELAGAAHRAANLVPGLDEAGDETAADVTGCPGDQDSHETSARLGPSRSLRGAPLQRWPASTDE
jgi:hypothetical protein